jgi:hypothetical protein
MLGIGLLGIAQVCHEFKVISHHKETGTAFQATVKLIDYLREKVDALETSRTDEDLEVGQFDPEEIDYDPSQAGTYVIAADMRSAFVRRFRENPGPPLPSKFPAFLNLIQRSRAVKGLGDYWQMIWELATACPIPYADEGPFLWDRVEAPPEFQEEFKALVRTLREYQFEVVVDGLSLRRPNVYPYPPTRRRSTTPMTGHLFPVDLDLQVYGRPLKLAGYIYMQDGQAIEPAELRGLLIRIRNVAIGSYDPTFLKYPKIEGPRFSWLSGEIHVQEGLEHALNIDRDSFNEMHPHYVRVQQLVHNSLKTVFTEASKGVDERSQARQQDQQKQRAKALRSFLNQELGGEYQVIESEESQIPLTVDTDQERVLINSQNALWPRAKGKRELAQLVAVAFELSMMVPESERRERFYKLLSRLLSL